MEVTKKLWTRDFTIITLGTVVSMLGNALSGFAIGLLVLDYTGSTFLYAMFMVAYSLPKIVMPFLAGPYLDKFSRKKVIYTLDFISSGLYVLLYFILNSGVFNFALLIGFCLLIGSIDSVYQVAYESYYPTLIPEGCFAKAYSVSSMIYPLSAVMVFVAAYCYENTLIGLPVLFLFNSVTFFIAAVFETRIKADEKHLRKDDKRYNLKEYMADFKDGMKYIKLEKGLMVITAYFVISTLMDGASSTLLMPYFKNDPSLGVMNYTYVMGCSVLGRLIGGWAHYKFKYPKEKKFAIALAVYIVSSIIGGTFLYTPMKVMMLMQFVSGFICVTSFNIRISSTQNYVPDTMRGRYNGTFQMLCTVGSILGQLVFGALGDTLPIKPIFLVSYAFCILAAILIVYRGRKHVKPIYNVEL